MTLKKSIVSPLYIIDTAVLFKPRPADPLQSRPLAWMWDTGVPPNALRSGPRVRPEGK